MKNEPLVIEKTYDAPIHKVWEALTDNDKMKQWYFDLPDFKPEIGYEFSFTVGASPDKQFLHECRITQLVPVKKIAYTWRYPGYAGNSEVSFELFGEGEKTRLRLMHTGLETFPTDTTDFALGNFKEGWGYFTTALENYLKK